MQSDRGASLSLPTWSSVKMPKEWYPCYFNLTLVFEVNKIRLCTLKGRNIERVKYRLFYLGQKYNKSVNQIVLKFLFSKDIGAVIESSNYEVMKQLFESWNFELSEEEQKKIKGLNKNYRVLNYEEYFKDEMNIFE